jgi:DNA helicase HerA-like ATPase
MNADVVGLVFGRATNTTFSFTVNPENIPKFGEFVIVKNRDGEDVLGVVKEITNLNKLIESEDHTFEYILRNIGYSKTLLEMNDIVIATARVLGVIDGNDIKPNRTPIKPSSEVKLASDEILRNLFRGDDNSIEIGNLLARENVPVGLNVKELVLRHFAILAVTGSGKSNTACVIINEIVRRFNGTVVLIDPHGEYLNFRFEDGTEKGKNILPSGIRPETLEPWEFATLVGISRDANVQRLHLERAFTTALHEGKSGKEFVERILEIVEEWIDAVSSSDNSRVAVPFIDRRGNSCTAVINRSRDLDSLLRVRDYVYMFLRNYNELLIARDMLANMKPGYLNIVSLSGFDELQMRVIVAYILKHLLIGRIRYKKGDHSYKSICPAVVSPILIMVEEGHIFAPKGEDNDVVRWMSRIAREGRKFGVGLGIISQRPKKLNDDILSQCNTKIILKIVEPNDQRYVQQASEQISEDLLSDIASLGRGEAVIVGSAVKLPVAVKIKKYPDGYYGGGDIDVVEEWNKLKRDFEIDLNMLVR